MANDRESAGFVIFQASTEGNRRLIKAAEVNLDFEEISLGNALYSGSLKSRHVRLADGTTLTNVDDSGFGIRSDHLREGAVEEAQNMRAGTDVCIAASGQKHVPFSSEMPGTSYSALLSFDSLCGGLFMYASTRGVEGFTMSVVDLANNPVDCSMSPVLFSWLVKNPY